MGWVEDGFRRFAFVRNCFLTTDLLMRFSIFALMASWMAVEGALGDVVIREFMASNDRTLEDDFGEESDWIELFNDGPVAVDLAGWRLTDRANQPFLWQFPSRVIGPGEHLVVYASGRNRRVSGQALHTNFSLSTQGEYLALIRPDGGVATEFAPAYPVQGTDVSYGFPQQSLVAAVPQGAAGQVGVPTSQTDYSNNFANWQTSLVNFTGTSWQNCQTGVGFDDPGQPYGAWIGVGGDISARMKNQQRTACLRVPFQITNASQVVSIKLRMRWDDGFIAWINGVEVARDAVPSTVSWNSVGGANRNEALNNDWTDFTLNPATLNLTTGTNLLAIHGFNTTSASSDFLVLPVVEVGYSAASPTPLYFTTPSPGAANVNGVTPGPFLTNATAGLPRPLGNGGSPAQVMTVRVNRTQHDVATATVRMAYRTMFGAETLVTMVDNGSGVDVVAGDGVYSALMPTTGPTAGQMLRWRFEAADVNGNIGRAPVYYNALDYDQYFGTVAMDATEGTTQLPLIHQFIENVSAAGTEAGTRCSLYYLGRFYDNVGVDLHGQSTASFAKKSHNFDFNLDNRFVVSETAARKLKDVDILSNHADKTRTRNTLAQEVSKLAGGVYHFAFPVRVQRNGLFHGVMDMMEDGDDRMLERNGLNPEGAFYKMYDSLASTGQGEKKTRREEDKSDLQALINGLNPNTALATRRTYAYDHLNVAATVNYLAIRQLMSDKDHGHKNYYVYRDTGRTNEWRPVIWDVDLTFGHDWNSGPGYFDDNIYSNSPIRPMQTELNRMYRIIAETPEFRAMYVRRFRTLMDQILQPYRVPNGILETRMRQIVATIDPDPAEPSAWTDGDLDFTKWGTWGRGLRPRLETEYVIANYFDPRRVFLANTNSGTRERYGLTAGTGDVLPNSAQVNVAGMVIFDGLDFNPGGGQDEEYVILRNTTGQAVDVSGWTVDGAIEHRFEGGTVIPAGAGTAGVEYQGLLHLVKDAAAFRSRVSGPTGGQKRLVQGNYSGQLSARGEMVNLRDASGLLIATLGYAGAPTVHQQALRVSEILYHPAAPTAGELSALPGVVEDDFEFVELVNVGGVALNLGGCRFSEGVEFTFPAVSLGAGERLILARRPEAFALRYPGNPGVVVGPYDGQLDNAGERLQLLDPVGEVVLDFEYKDGWYPLTDGSGRSLVLRDEGVGPDGFGDAVVWGISGGLAGSPGGVDAVVGMTYRGWDHFHFTALERDDPGISGEYADPDADGRPNWLEYAYGCDPRVADGEMAEFDLAAAGGGVLMRRPVGAMDLVYELEANGVLDGLWPVVGHEVEPVAKDGVVESVILREEDPVEADGRFFRVRVHFQP